MTMRCNRLKNISGFTLIELLVVIAIIAILAAILFPVFVRAKEQGRVATCANNLKHVVTATHLYVDDWNGRLPNSGYFGWVWFVLQPHYISGDPNSVPYIQDLLAKYVKNSKIWLCPSLKPNQRFSRNPDAGGSYNFNNFFVRQNCGTTRAGKNAPTNYLWVHWRRTKSGGGNVYLNGRLDVTHSWVSGELASKMLQPTKVIIFLEFPYWYPSPHKIFDKDRFSVGDNVAYYDGHVKLVNFSDTDGYTHTWDGWE